jgi:1-acyl-sn-glycerol-3-phosphate acyltransferase
MTTAHDLVRLDSDYFGDKRIEAQGIAGKCFEIYHRIFTRIKIEGRENLPADGPLVIVGNHRSFYDPPLFTVSTQMKIVYFAKQELWDTYWLGRFLTWVGAVPVNRKRPEISRIKFLRMMMKRGWSIGMFIEGTRCKIPGKLGKPNVGPAYFAKVTGAPILPIGFINTDKRFGPVTVRIGKVMQGSDDLEETTWRIMEALSQLTGYEISERKLAKEDE